MVYGAKKIVWLMSTIGTTNANFCQNPRDDLTISCWNDPYDYHLMYRMPVIIIPVVLGCTGVVSPNCIKHLYPKVLQSIIFDCPEGSHYWERSRLAMY